MALRLRFQYSLDFGTLGVGATWTQFADIADSGTSGNVLHATPTIGTTYWYRVQRYDTVTGLSSAWSDTYQYTATLPQGNSTTMSLDTLIDPCSIITAADLKFGVAFEMFPGVPAKARWLARCEGGYIQRQLSRRYGKVREGGVTARRRSAAKGQYTFQGTLRFTFTPERAIPTMIGTAFPITTTVLATPTRYEHKFLNKKTCKTVTLWVRLSDTEIICYPGMIVNNLSFDPSVGGTDVLDIQFQVEATDAFHVRGATALADSGMNTAAMDLLPEYPQETFVWSVGGNAAGLRDFNVSMDLDIQPIMQRPFNAPTGFFNKSTGIEIKGTSYFQGVDRIASDMGYASTPAGNFGPVCTTPLTSVAIVASPCPPTGQAFANLFTLSVPVADVIASEDSGDTQGEIEQSVSVNAIYDATNALGTDFSMSIVNSQTSAQLNLPGAAVDPLKVPVTNSRPYAYDKVGAGASTTVIPLASINNLHISAVDGDYVGRTLRIYKASDGTLQTGTISAYTAPTNIAAGSVTIAVAVAVAPSAGDVVVFL